MSHILQVGKLYHPDRVRWPERADFNVRSGAPELRLFVAAPTANETQAVSRGVASFALFVEQPVILFCYQFAVTGQAPAFPWSDAPFSIHLLSAAFPDEGTPPELPQPFEERSLLQVLLVEAGSGILKVIRALTLPPDFSAELAVAVREQSELTWNEAQFDSALKSIYSRYPSSQSLIGAARIRGKGGK